MKNDVSGINYLDVYFRGGVFPLPSLPAILGVEGAGVVERLGPGVEGFAVGDRVAYFHAGSGAVNIHCLFNLGYLCFVTQFTFLQLGGQRRAKC